MSCDEILTLRVYYFIEAREAALLVNCLMRLAAGISFTPTGCLHLFGAKQIT